MSTICILASTGSAVATIGVFGFLFLGRLIVESNKPERGLVAWLAIAAAIGAVGMGSCAAEDRICEVAGLQP